MDNLIKSYFRIGLNYNDILVHLFLNHGIDISKSTLKRKLKKLGLYKRKKYSDLESEVMPFLISENKKSGQLHGYRWLHLKCFQNGIIIPRQIVQTAISVIDPEGVAARKKKRLKRRIYANKGPDYLYHLDGYDKLKRFGICVHGCCDGYSRFIIWLKASTSNNDPRIVAGFYLNAIEDMGGVPLTIRTDRGTENVLIRDLQQELRCIDTNRPAHLYGTSPHNQRIESWWGQLRKQNAQFWMDFFQSMVNEGSFCGDKVDKELIRFFFMEIIQEELDSVKMVWNAHNIRKSKTAVAPSGRPFNMFYSPEMYGVKSYLVPVEREIVIAHKERCIFEDLPCDSDFYELITILMEENNLRKSKDIDVAKHNYVTVREIVRQLLE